MYKTLLYWKVNFLQLILILSPHLMLTFNNFPMRRAKRIIKVLMLIILIVITKKNKVINLLSIKPEPKWEKLMLLIKLIIILNRILMIRKILISVQLKKNKIVSITH
jgi:hypothetical protein